MIDGYRNPVPTVDLIIHDEMNRVVLIKRKNPPPGWALPGGFVDYGESLESAARREALEETSLTVSLERQYHTYSDPSRDPRKHTITTVFIATIESGLLQAADDATEAKYFTREEALEKALAFDHKMILEDYYLRRY